MNKSVFVLLSCVAAVSMGAATGSSVDDYVKAWYSFPVVLSSAEFVSSVSDPSGSNVIVITRPRKGSRVDESWYEAAPWDVWRIPLAPHGPMFDKAEKTGEIPQGRRIDVTPSLCIHDDTLYCAYAIMWHGERGLSFKALPLAGTWPGLKVVGRSKMLIDGQETEEEGLIIQFDPPNTIQALRYAEEDGGKRVTVPRPVAIYVDGESRLCIVGSDEQGCLFLISSEDKGGTWSDAKLLVRPVPKTHRPFPGTEDNSGAILETQTISREQLTEDGH